MGRYVGPSCRLCRREGMKLFLKGARCNMAKCAIERGKPAPGMHVGRAGRGKQSDYGMQLREKQRLRRHYGMQEGQFRLFFDRAMRGRGITGERLLQLLELRLDNLVYRTGMMPSRRAARQFVVHKHVMVNGRPCNVPSRILKKGDRVSVCDDAATREAVKLNLEAATLEPASWLAFDPQTFGGEILHEPSREEIAPFVRENLIVELYSK